LGNQMHLGIYLFLLNFLVYLNISFQSIPSWLCEFPWYMLWYAHFMSIFIKLGLFSFLSGCLRVYQSYFFWRTIFMFHWLFV
jgi:hypothetical protein